MLMTDTMDLYRDIILDHYKHPRNFGHLEKSDVVVEEGNVTCGDKIQIEIKCQMPRSQSSGQANAPFAKLRASKCQITDMRFSGEGCAISMASASLLTEKVIGMSVDEVMKLSIDDILIMLGTTLTPSRTKCALLSLEVLQKGIVEYQKKTMYSKVHGPK